MAKPAIPPVSTRPRLGRRQLARECTTSVPHSCPSSAHPVLNVGAKNRRYAAVLSRLNKLAGTTSQSSSSAFSGYVPKCRQNNSVQCKNAVTKSVSDGSSEQRKSKVSFCLQTSRDDTFSERKMATLSSRRVVTTSSSTAASVTSVTVSCSETVTSAAATHLPLTTVSSSELHVASVPHVQIPTDSSELSLLCAELFVDNNTSFCDQLLESCPVPYEQPDAPDVMPGSSSFNSKQDIPEPVTDFAFDDFVEFDELFSCT